MKDVKKQLKQYSKRMQATQTARIQQLAAAFIDSEQIKPSEAILVQDQKQVKDDDGSTVFRTRFWMQKKSDCADIAEAHPDIKMMFDLAFQLAAANRRQDVTAVAVGLEALEDFYKKYEAEFDETANPKNLVEY